MYAGEPPDDASLNQGDPVRRADMKSGLSNFRGLVNRVTHLKRTPPSFSISSFSFSVPRLTSSFLRRMSKSRETTENSPSNAKTAGGGGRLRPAVVRAR